MIPHPDLQHIRPSQEMFFPMTFSSTFSVFQVKDTRFAQKKWSSPSIYINKIQESHVLDKLCTPKYMISLATGGLMYGCTSCMVVYMYGCTICRKHTQRKRGWRISRGGSIWHVALGIRRSWADPNVLALLSPLGTGRHIRLGYAVHLIVILT